MEKLHLDGVKILVPTYNGKWLDDHPGLEEYDEPEVPVLICPAEGLRIILGTHDYHDYEKPDIQVERRHNGWMIFLHPLGGCDACGYVVMLDDGRNYVAAEKGAGDYGIEMVAYDEAIAELDDIKPSGLSCTPTMVVEKPFVENADCDQREAINEPPVPPIAIAHLPISRTLIDAIKSAQDALVGDSNDDEHEALLALVEALDQCNLDEQRS